MGKIGYGYGSEWHLMWYLARHRTQLNEKIKDTTGADGVEWLDFPSLPSDTTDAEWRGLAFVEDDTVQASWRKFWPQRAGIQNWDAVGQIEIGGRREWLLVEAKAHCGEILSSCSAKPEGGLEQIGRSLDRTKVALGVDPSRDWMSTYYQFCNRVAVLHFLQSLGHHAQFLNVYFTGDSARGRECPQDPSGWQAALAAQDVHVGLPEGHALTTRIHKIFLPAFSIRNENHL